MPDGTFTQYGGQHTISNALTLSGNYKNDHGFISTDQPTYNLSGGMLLMPALNLRAFGFFNQAGGTNLIAGNLSVIETTYTLSGGMLSNANMTLSPSNTLFGYAVFQQNGGAHIIGGALINQSNDPFVTSEYRLSGGSLSVPTIVMRGHSNLLIVSNTPSIITP